MRSTRVEKIHFLTPDEMRRLLSAARTESSRDYSPPLTAYRHGLRFVQDWLGHSNIQNTTIYTHLVSSSRTDKARSLFLKLPRF